MYVELLNVFILFKSLDSVKIEIFVSQFRACYSGAVQVVTKQLITEIVVCNLQIVIFMQSLKDLYRLLTETFIII